MKIDFLKQFSCAVRNRFKRNENRKINIVFVCQIPDIWGSLKTVYEACLNDDAFNVTVVALPDRKRVYKWGLSRDLCTNTGSEEFCKNFKGTVINGYDWKKQKCFPLKRLRPDYVFLQRPYDVHLPKKYRSDSVSKYAKLCYVHYAANFIGGAVFDETYPEKFMRHVYMVFTADKFDDAVVSNRLKSTDCLATKTRLTGFPRYDELKSYVGCDSDNWNFERKDNLKRVIWTPRWNTKEGNCHFFEYKDKLLEYAENHADVDFIFRPHPYAFSQWISTGELSREDADNYKRRMAQLPNAKIDSRKEYLTTFYSSDILITDISSIVAEYFLTGKPVVYCHKKDCFNDFSLKISEGFYWVRNWEELKETMEMLKSGKDPLKEKRQEIIESEFYIPKTGAGETIKNIIKEDFFGKNSNTVFESSE